MNMCVYEILEKAVYEWMIYIRNINMPTSDSLIKEKAIYFHQQFGFIDFRANSGWLNKFKSLHTIVFKVICVDNPDI